MLMTTNKTPNTSNIMLTVILACVPGIILNHFIYGNGILLNIIYSIIFALIIEALCVILKNNSRKQIKTTLLDYSAIITAILFAICLPPNFSIYKIFIGMIFAICICKHIYGGLGHNIFNPAMVGYVILLVSFPDDFTNLPIQNSIIDIFSNSHPIDFDDISQATPLDPLIKRGDFSLNIDVSNIYLTSLYNVYISNIIWLISGLYLVYKKIIPIILPIGFLSAIFITAFLIQLSGNSIIYSPFQHLFLGSTMLAAFFIITDPVTAASNTLGKLIYSFLAGLFCYLIREYGSYPDGIGFAVIFMNSLVPLINKMTLTGVSLRY